MQEFKVVSFRHLQIDAPVKAIKRVKLERDNSHHNYSAVTHGLQISCAAERGRN